MVKPRFSGRKTKIHGRLDSWSFLKHSEFIEYFTTYLRLEKYHSSPRMTPTPPMCFVRSNVTTTATQLGKSDLLGSYCWDWDWEMCMYM